MLKLSILFLLFTLDFKICVFAETPDVHFKKSIEIEIKESAPDKYVMKMASTLELALLTDRSLQNNSILSVVEPFYAPFTEIKGFVNKKKIDKDMIFSTFVESADVFFSDYKTHFLKYGSQLKKTDIISYQTNQTYKDINYFPFIYIPNVNKLEEYSVTIKHPENVIPEFDFFFPRDSIKYSIQQNGQTETILKIKNLSQETELSNFEFNDFHCVVSVNLYKNGINLIARNPAEFVDWYKTLVKFAPEITKSIPEEIELNLNRSQTNLEKIKVLYDFVRGNVRYIADMKNQHSFIPHAPDYVLNGLYGDCKDKAYLIHALANRIGLKVNLVLVNTKNGIPVAGVHIMNYNHVICSYDENGNTYYFDPTSKYTEFGNLPDYDIFSQSFVMDTLNPELKMLPAPLQNSNISLKIDGDSDSLKSATALITLRNDYFSNTLRAKNELRKIDLENFLNKTINNNFYRINLEDFKVVSSDEGSITIRAKADLSSFVIDSKNKKYLPKIPFIIYDKTIIERDSDSGDINLDSRQSIDFELNLVERNSTAKDDFFDEKVSKNFLIRSEFKTLQQGSFQLKATLILNGKVVRKNEKPEFISFAKSILKGKTQMYIMNRSL